MPNIPNNQHPTNSRTSDNQHPTEGTLIWTKKEWEKMINPVYMPLVYNTDRYKILWGSRGSGKSDFVCLLLLYYMLTEPYFRGIIVRKSYENIKTTTFAMLVTVMQRYKLEKYFEYSEAKTSAPQILCKVNGNKVIPKGLDKPESFKSMAEVTCVFYDEDLVSEEEYITISTSLRTKKARFISEIFAINPDLGSDYKSHWFWDRFFKPNYEINPEELSFRTITKNKNTEVACTVIHSTWKDNEKNLQPGYLLELEQLKKRTPWMYEVFYLGKFTHRINENGFYHNFVYSKTVIPKSESVYDPQRALHLAIDFNYNPGMHATVWQLSGNTAVCINEIKTTSPNNNSMGLVRKFKSIYPTHDAGLLIFGDVSNRAGSTKLEYGHNDYTIIAASMAEYRPKICLPNLNPPIVPRRDFLNSIFSENSIVKIKISDVCVGLIRDLTEGKQNSDGTKLDEKETKNGITYEKYHHFSDGMDYIICEAYKSEFQKFKRGGLGHIPRTQGREPINKSIRY